MERWRVYVPVNCDLPDITGQTSPSRYQKYQNTMKPILETNLAIYFIKCQRGELSTVHFCELHQLNPPSPPRTDDKY